MSQKKKMLIGGALALALVISIVAIALAVGSKKETPQNTDTDQKQTTDQTKTEDEKNNPLLGEKFSDASAKVSFYLPKDWQLAPKNPKDSGSLTKFEQTTTRANGELLKRRAGDMDDIVRPYLEGALNISLQSKLLHNEDVRIGDKVVRLVSHDVPGPGGQTARITEYIYVKGDTYYIVAFTLLASDWESQQAAIEASVESVTIQ
jgi:hypothetical protein